MTTNAGSRAVGLLEEAWHHARTTHAPDLPDVGITLKLSGNVTARGITLGHFAPERIATPDDDKLHEVMISGTTIHRGPVSLLTTLVHEAAHALAAARGIKDTSRQNRYHNMKFVRCAEELGMYYPHKWTSLDPGVTPKRLHTRRPDDTIGYSDVRLTVVSQHSRYRPVLDLLEREFPFKLGTPPLQPIKPVGRDHAYVIAPRIDLAGEYYDVVQLSPKKYERLSPYLADHEVVYTRHTQDHLISELLSRGYPIHLSTEEYAR